MSALRAIAWGLVDFEVLDHRQKLELFAAINKEIRRRPHKLKLLKDGVLSEPTPTGAYKDIYRYRLLNKPRRLGGGTVRNVILYSSPMLECCQRALNIIDPNWRR